jgi:NAD(P)-dependent dehydrogenase (short-subunit alcohol dehydrogenase family)
MAMPDEIANVIEYLTFDAPDYLTGTALLVDGGLYA